MRLMLVEDSVERCRHLLVDGLGSLACDDVGCIAIPAEKVIRARRAVCAQEPWVAIL